MSLAPATMQTVSITVPKRTKQKTSNNQKTTSVAPLNYAAQANAYYKTTTNNCVSLDVRFQDTINAMPPHDQMTVNHMIAQSVAEFKRQYSHVKSWEDLTLAQAVYVPLYDIFIDTTMQRMLDLHWVAKILAKFKTTKVVPIQVYRDDSGRLCAWDGQHTAMMLWLICVHVLKLNPADVKVPVNIYSSSKKSEMRECFLDLNSSEGKKTLDLIDHWMQQVFGVRVDNSKNPEWVETEKKQSLIESYNLFVTHDKFNNAHMPGAISRLQEVNKLGLKPLTWLCKYLDAVMNGQRPVVEKEMVMMSHFFLRCYVDNIPVDDNYIQQLASIALLNWNGDFSPEGRFWAQVKVAYDRWHASNPMNGMITPKLSKEPIHGFPFLLAQLAKSMPGAALPRNTSNSNFWPANKDLF